MGRVKTQSVKRTTYSLMDLYGKSFTKDFKKNKEFVKKVMITPSKKITNTVAGYVTRLAKKGFTTAPRNQYQSNE